MRRINTVRHRIESVMDAMAVNKLEASNFDIIIKKTVDAVNSSKTELYDIADNARKECENIEKELDIVKIQTKDLMKYVSNLEIRLKDSKHKLMLVSKNFENCSQEVLRKAYEEAEALLVELTVKREQENQSIKRRNELDLRLKNSKITMEKAEKLFSHLTVSLDYLTGDLKQVSVQLENAEQSQMFGLRIIKAQEEERQRVAREIHDGPAQSMSNVVLKAEICERLIDIDKEKVRAELRNLKREVRESLQDVRKIIYNLRPMSLDDLGLVPTIQRYISTYNEETGIDISLKTVGTYEFIRPVVSLTVFRIIQEATNNIKKYAGAKKVSIGIEFLGKKLIIYISDDGKGFDMEILKIKRDDINSGFGLLSMKERVELLGGEFSITSTIGAGTRFNISLPLDPNEEGA